MFKSLLLSLIELIVKYSLILSFICVLSTKISAQQYNFKHFDIKDSLPSTQIYTVFQDSKGYIWFGTDAGIARYDGIRVTKYSLLDGIEDNTIFGFYEDFKGRIWYRTFKGSIGAIYNNSIVKVRCNSSLVKQLGKASNSSLFVDEGDTIWIGFRFGENVFKIPPANQWLSVDKINVSSYSRYVYQIGNNHFVYGTNLLPQNDTCLYFIKNKRIKKIKLPYKSKLPISNETKLIKLKNGGYIYGIGSSVFKFNKNLEIEKVLELNSSVIALLEDKKSNLWIGTLNSGVFKYNSNLILIENYLKEQSVSWITHDKENAYWFATLGAGVFYIPSFDYKYWNEKNGLSEEKIYAYKEFKKVKFVAFDSKGAFVINNTDTLKIKSVVKDFISLNSDSVLIIGEKNYCYSFQKKKIVPVNLNYFIYKIQKQNDLIYFSTFGDILMLNPKTFEVQEFNLSKSRPFSFYVKSESEYYFGSNDGLWKNINGNSIHFAQQYQSLSNRISDIKPYKNNWLLIATKGYGLIILKDNKIVNSISVKNGLVSNLVKKLEVDSMGNVWVCTNSGLSIVKFDQTISNYSIENINSGNGIISDEINDVFINNKEVFLSSSKGLVRFSYSNLNNEKFYPEVYLNEFKINDQKFEIKSNYVLKFNENDIDLALRSVYYRSSKPILYRYKMIGINDDWKYTSQTNLQYPQLSPGSYTFIAQAQGDTGCWSKVPIKIAIKIEKAWWQTVWFICLVIIVFLALVSSLLYYNYLRKLNKKMKEAEIEQNITKLKLSALTAQMNPHFTFNAINSIQKFILKNDKENAYHYLGSFAKLMRGVLEFSIKEKVTIEEEINSLEVYMELESLRFDFKYSISIDEHISKEEFKIPPMIIQPFIENAILHGLNYKEGEKILSVNFNVDSYGNLVCEIKDNGIGREESKKINGLNSKKSISRGMDITKKRLEIVNANYEENVRFIDELNDNGSPAGTTVIVKIPYSI